MDRYLWPELYQRQPVLVMANRARNIHSQLHFYGPVWIGKLGGLMLETSSQSNLITLHAVALGQHIAKDFGDMIELETRLCDGLLLLQPDRDNVLYSAGHALINLRCGRNVIRGTGCTMKTGPMDTGIAAFQRFDSNAGSWSLIEIESNCLCGQ